MCLFYVVIPAGLCCMENMIKFVDYVYKPDFELEDNRTYMIPTSIKEVKALG